MSPDWVAPIAVLSLCFAVATLIFLSGRAVMRLIWFALNWGFVAWERRQDRHLIDAE